MLEASGVHRQEALTRQAVSHASPLACTVGPHGFLKEASTCRIEAAGDICVQHISGLFADDIEYLFDGVLA